MCGIIGFIDSQKNVIPNIIEGLKNLEYRGYDSAGVAWFERTNFKIVKSKGRINFLEDKLKKIKNLNSFCGIGHTRWATHGEPKDVNSHPHLGGIDSYNFAIVHNGIIENYQEIHEFLKSKNYTFKSETDTENVAHLIDYYYRLNPKRPIQQIIRKVLNQIKGSFSFAIIQKDRPDQIIVTRRDSPLLIGLGKTFNIVSSDTTALIKHTKDYIILDDNEIGIIKSSKVTIFNKNNNPIKKQINKITWDISKSQKNGFKHYMLKEIHEEPKVVENITNVYLKKKNFNFGFNNEIIKKLKNIENISIVACGSALYAGMIGNQLFESIAKVKSYSYVASEFRYQNPILNKNDICLLISQSGETADTIAALREAKSKKILTVAIVNVVSSTIAREADVVLYTHAGPEIAVATTKAYLSQISLLSLLALYIGKLKQKVTDNEIDKIISDFYKLPKLIQKILNNKKDIQKLATNYYSHNNVFFIGRGLDYASCLEGSLKLKEISYIYSEAYAAGELKHGTISLIENKTLVIALATQPHVYEKMISNIEEVIARGASILMISNKKIDKKKLKIKNLIQVPEINSNLTFVLNTIVLQLFAYYIAMKRGCDIDKPRNLAKSVTVE
ncbi:glutamine--fructose-6-phosphate transaminase (isomerizing) [Mycoplasmoides pirum]|uniref:glutamine--fructose-6-phosphate transaminase (isomerizing) n=1 Tax=Mycoplasmoides pirum TaxID=2122 RepID=UPI000482FE73|nr:glutamine--fructose-6-phosphate transaminase (isomerizing) [Mycoplasmoides pirum]